MSEIYEAATEVREVVKDVAYRLDNAVEAIHELSEFVGTRRDRFAAVIAAAIIGRGMPRDAESVSSMNAAAWCKVVWQLADALDDADPKKTTMATVKAAAHKQPECGPEGIDLSDPFNDEE